MLIRVRRKQRNWISHTVGRDVRWEYSHLEDNLAVSFLSSFIYNRKIKQYWKIGIVHICIIVGQKIWYSDVIECYSARKRSYILCIRINYKIVILITKIKFKDYILYISSCVTFSKLKSCIGWEQIIAARGQRFSVGKWE